MSYAKENAALRMSVAAWASARSWSTVALNCKPHEGERQARCKRLATAFTLNGREHAAQADAIRAKRDHDDRAAGEATAELNAVATLRARLQSEGLCAYPDELPRAYAPDAGDY